MDYGRISTARQRLRLVPCSPSIFRKLSAIAMLRRPSDRGYINADDGGRQISDNDEPDDTTSGSAPIGTLTQSASCARGSDPIDHGHETDDADPNSGTVPLDSDEHEGLVAVLSEIWSLGQMGASTVQRIAAAALRSSESSVSALARIGASGSRESNAPRDLRRLIRDETLPPTYTFLVPSTDVKRKEAALSPCEVLLPHQIFSWVSEAHPAFFSTWADGAVLADFWQTANGH